MSWLDSLPTWLYWLLLSPLIALGLGVFWVVVIWLNSYPGDSFFKGGDDWKEEGLLRGLFVMVVSLMVGGVYLTAICALFFIPAPVYRYVLGWSWDDAMLYSPFTIFALIGLLGLWSSWDDKRQEKRKLENRPENGDGGETAP